MSYAFAYVDASFCNEQKFATCAVKVLYSDKSVLHCFRYTCDNSTIAERMAVERALGVIKAKELTIFTDCKGIVDSLEYVDSKEKPKMKHLRETKVLRKLRKNFSSIHIEWIPEVKSPIMSIVHKIANKAMKKQRKKIENEKTSQHPTNP